jgi:hypothetical protein
MSASPHARVIVSQSIRVDERVASSRHSAVSLRITATQLSREQAL